MKNRLKWIIWPKTVLGSIHVCINLMNDDFDSVRDRNLDRRTHSLKYSYIFWPNFFPSSWTQLLISSRPEYIVVRVQSNSRSSIVRATTSHGLYLYIYIHVHMLTWECCHNFFILPIARIRVCDKYMEVNPGVYPPAYVANKYLIDLTGIQTNT